MRPNNKYEQGNTNPMITLAILISMGIFAYLAVDSMNSDDPSTWSLYSTWLGWSWWAKGLSIVGPIILLLIGSNLDNASRFGNLPSDDE